MTPEIHYNEFPLYVENLSCPSSLEIQNVLGLQKAQVRPFSCVLYREVDYLNIRTMSYIILYYYCVISLKDPL